MHIWNRGYRKCWKTLNRLYGKKWLSIGKNYRYGAITNRNRSLLAWHASIEAARCRRADYYRKSDITSVADVYALRKDSFKRFPVWQLSRSRDGCNSGHMNRVDQQRDPKSDHERNGRSPETLQYGQNGNSMKRSSPCTAMASLNQS